MKIATVFKHGTANAQYRAILPLKALERQGHQVFWPSRDGGLLGYLEQNQPRWDVTLIQQLSSPDEIEAVRRLQAAGVAVVWDNDDDMSAMPKNSPSYRRYGGKKGVKRLEASMTQIACMANLMTTPSPHLAEMYRRHGVEHVRVIENYIDGRELRHQRRRHAGIVIGVCAAFEHEHDLKKLKIGKILQAVLARHDAVRVVALGLDLGMSGHRYTRTSDVPFSQLLAVERTFDIGLAPLVDAPFARARSNVKLKEYAAAGAMWMASPVGPYIGMGEEQGGVLVDDDDWFDALDRLLVDHDRRVALAERARKWARGQTVEVNLRQWEQAFRGAIERARSARRLAVR